MNKAKKLYLATILLLTFIITQAKISIATQETIVKVYPYQNVAAPGQQFTTSIVVENVQNLFAVEVKLYWNQSILQLINKSVMLGVESNPGGVLHGQVYWNETIEKGKYVLWGTSVGKETPSFNGSGTLVKLTFNVTGIGNCQLTLQTKLYDKPAAGSASQPIQHSIENGYYSPLYLSCTPNQAAVGDKINISGYIALTNQKPTILIKYGNATGWYQLASTTADNNGNYKYIWTAEKEGDYQIKAVAQISGVTVESAVQKLSVYPKSETWQSTYIAIIIAIIVAITAIILAFYTKKRKAKGKK
jgi:hypothetical protein